MKVTAAARKCYPNELLEAAAKLGVERGSDPRLVCRAAPCCVLETPVSHRQTPHLANDPSTAESLTVRVTAHQVRAKGFSFRDLALPSNPRSTSF